MKIIRTVKSLKKTISNVDNLGFVPTMGGIHIGHLSLIKKSIIKSTKHLYLFTSILLNLIIKMIF